MNRNTRLLLALTSAFILFAPVATAQDLAERERSFCNLLPERSLNIRQGMTEKRGKLSNSEASTRDLGEKFVAGNPEKIRDIRDKGDNFREQSINLLLSKQTDENQGGVIGDYRQALAGLMSVRRQANDQRFLTYRQSVSDFVESEIDRITQDFNNFESQVESAIIKAEQGCNLSNDIAAVRSDLVNELKSARLEYSDKRRQSYSDVNVRLEAFSEVLEDEGSTLIRAFELGVQQIGPKEIQE